MDANNQFEQIKPRSMRHDVLGQLRGAILAGTFRPGERLNESEIARQMGISRGPVREAILALEQEGLIETVHWRGSFVVQLDPQSVRDLMDLRILLETHAAVGAARRAGPADLAELEGIIGRMRAACGEGNLEELVNHDLDFHRTICRLGGNPLLLKTWEQLAGRVRLGILLSVENGYDAASMVETHPPVLEAMRRGEGEVAARLLNDRTWAAADDIFRALASRSQPAAAGAPATGA